MGYYNKWQNKILKHGINEDLLTTWLKIRFYSHCFFNNSIKPTEKSQAQGKKKDHSHTDSLIDHKTNKYKNVILSIILEKKLNYVYIKIYREYIYLIIWKQLKTEICMMPSPAKEEEEKIKTILNMLIMISWSINR